MTPMKDIKASVREPIWKLANAVARPTAGLRVMPDYLIIGAQRCGTTSLQNVLTSHPNITSARLMKGVHYFDTARDRSVEWYRSHFPTNTYAALKQATTGTPLRVGEASPYYIFHPTAAEHIAATIPGVKLIALLRDPVERTISHHKHEVRRGNEELELEAALDAEAERLRGEESRVRTDRSYNSWSLQTYSYTARSRYAEQIERLRRHFDPEQIMVVQSEAFFNDPRKVFARILRFIDAPPHDPDTFPRINATKPVTAPAHIIDRLRNEFREPNRALFDLIGEEFPWQ